MPGLVFVPNRRPNLTVILFRSLYDMSSRWVLSYSDRRQQRRPFACHSAPIWWPSRRKNVICPTSSKYSCNLNPGLDMIRQRTQRRPQMVQVEIVPGVLNATPQTFQILRRSSADFASKDRPHGKAEKMQIWRLKGSFWMWWDLQLLRHHSWTTLVFWAGAESVSRSRTIYRNENGSKTWPLSSVCHLLKSCCSLSSFPRRKPEVSCQSTWCQYRPLL